LIDLERDPEKWEPVFRKDHAQTTKIMLKQRDEIMIRFILIMISSRELTTMTDNPLRAGTAFVNPHLPL
jgi:hypothetical protein